MHKIDRTAHKKIKALVKKHKKHMPRSATGNHKSKVFNASMGGLHLSIGSLCLIDPTGVSASIYFGIAAMNLTSARLAEREQNNTLIINKAHQRITGREDVVHCLQAIDKKMQEEALHLELCLYTQSGRTGGKHIHAMKNLQKDAETLLPYVQISASASKEILFEIDTEDAFGNDDCYKTYTHTEFIDAFRKAAKKTQDAEAEEQRRAQKAAAMHQAQKLKR